MLHVAVIGGGNGQLARSLAETAAKPESGCRVSLLGRPDFDLAEPAALPRLLAALAPQAVINAAAYTAVDRAESEPDAAFRINRDGAAAIAAACAGLGLPLVHVSTDYVFDGSGRRPWREDDPCAPTGVYGRSKLEGEYAVQAALPAAVILRTAWVHSPFGANFVRTMLRLAGERDRLRVVADQQGCPTYAPDLAVALLALVRRRAGAPGDPALGGIFHLAGAGATSWHGLAREVMAVSQRLGGPHKPVDPIATADYPTPARRPANSVLDCSRIASAYDLGLPDWRDGAARCVARLLKT
jgi:dTDP-4-dehydrorhamnose reductase